MQAGLARAVWGLAAAVALMAAPAAWADDGRTLVSAVKPLVEDQHGKRCEATFVVALDPGAPGSEMGGAEGPAIAGAIGVIKTPSGTGMMIKIGVRAADGTLTKPASLVVATGAGDNGSELFHVGESSDPGYRLFMFNLSPATQEALGRAPIRMTYAMEAGGPVSSFAVDLTIADGKVSPAVRDATAPGRFAECMKALR